MNDALLEEVILNNLDGVKLALALGTKGLVNIQYLIYENELYVIEVNPRASRTVPYISKVTDVPMVDATLRNTTPFAAGSSMMPMTSSRLMKDDLVDPRPP